MKTKNTHKAGKNHVVRGFLTAMALVVTSPWTQAAVITTFGETVPITNIITSYEPGAQDQNAWFNDGPTENGIRLVSQSFITPGSSDYSMERISMKFNLTLAMSFPSALPFSIDFYQLATPGLSPTTGTYLSSRGGSMMPTTAQATAGSYFTFTMDTPLALTAGTSYGYVLAFDTANVSQLFRLAISASDADPAGTKAWQITNGGAWVNTGETYVNYIQGTAIPEPTTLGLLVIGASGALLLRRRVEKSLR
jgi:hypothetical protein